MTFKISLPHDLIIAMFGNKGEDVLILFSGTPWGRFCSEGRKHSIVNGQSFRLPIERPRKPLSEVRCFTPFWVIQGDVIALRILVLNTGCGVSSRSLRLFKGML